MPIVLSPRAPAPRPPTWLDTGLVVAPERRLIALALAVGLAGDLALRAGDPGLAASLLVVVAMGALLGSGRIANPHAQLLALAAPMFGMWLALRSSPWLVPLDLLAASGLLAAGASLARGGSVVDQPPRSVVGRVVHGTLHLALAPGMLAGPAGASEPTRARAASALRGVGIAVPVVGMLGALLASADVVFASLVDVDLGADDAIGHVVAIVAAGWVGLGLLRITSADDPVDAPPLGLRLGAVEATIVLAAVAALFAVFVASSVITAAGGADHVLATAGLTRAEYARSGFFQLLWVAGLTVAGLLTVAGTAELEGANGRRLRPLCGAVVVLALPIVAVALVRLDLYRDAYGLTMLRLMATVVAVWLGLVLVLLGVVLAGPVVLRRRGWFLPASIGAGLVMLLGLNIVNPEAIVARHNLTRGGSVAVDPHYLTELSDDAVPTIADLLPTLDPATAAAVAAAVGCPERGDDGWAGWNLAESRAARARARLCRA